MTWVLDERAHAGPEHLDDAYVAAYDTKAGLDPAEEVRLLRRYGLCPETTLVDFGAGTGIVFDFEPGGAAVRINEWLSAAAATPSAGWTRSEIEAHIRTEHSTHSWLLSPLLEHAGFAIVEAFVRRGIDATYVCRPR